MGLKLHGSTYTQILKINAVNEFTLPYDFLNTIFFSLVYCNIVYDTYNIENAC